jgi:phage shock protein PspC (stress-responsive transcriptional regulator)
MSSREKTLYRLPDEAMIGGVCAGVADRYDLDVALVRAVFAGLTVFSGFGLVAYLALWYLLDPPPSTDAVEMPIIDGPAARSGVAASDDIVDVDAKAAERSTSNEAT